jgi:hypothetical protein
MLPEDSAEAGTDLKVQLVIIIQWEAFTLSSVYWLDPVGKFKKKHPNYL